MTDLSVQARGIVEERVTALRAEMAIPGVAARVMRDGETIADYATGERWIGGPEPDTATVFRIASMTKSFTASAVLLLRDRGLLRLDDAVAQFLSVKQVDGPPITIRDLLTMNAGLPTDDPWGDRMESLPYADFDAMVAEGLSFTHMPRTGFEYSNAGYALLGRVISRVNGVDYLDFVRTELLEPLGMLDSRFDAEDVPTAQRAIGYAQFDAGLTTLPMVRPGSFSAMGGLHSTTADLQKWVNGFLGLGEHPLSLLTRKEMQHSMNWARTLVVGDRTITASYAYGLMTDDNSALGRFVHHSGGYPGYGSHMRWHPQSGWAIVLLGNRTYANMRRVGEECMNALVEQFPRPADPELWPRTREAMSVCERLLTQWDDALADQWCSVNVDLDRPRAERRAEWQRVGEGIESPQRGAVTSQSPAHASWSIRDGEIQVSLEVLLSPENPSLIQHLAVRLS